jgi:Tol biopolymer transport system component
MGAAVALLATTLLVAQSQPSSDVRLKAAQQKEEVEGDLTGAIELYDMLARSSDRPIAASALLRMAGCYQKLGDVKARQIYDRLVRDFADQREIAAVARARLDVLAKTAAWGGTEPARRSSPGAGLVVRPLPGVDPANDLQALSSDGTKATFITYGKGQNLAVYDFASRQATLLTDFDWSNTYAYYGTWSPDRQRVAYMQGGVRSLSFLELRSTTLDGESRVLYRNEAALDRQVAPADWLPDGRNILVVLERADRTFSVGLVPAAGGPFTALRSLQWSGHYPDLPKASPDGRFVALADGAQGMRDIHVLSIDGRTASRLTDNPADDSQPRWSPDGRYVAFMSNRNGTIALWAVAVKDGQAAGEAFRVKEGMQDTRLLDWTTLGLGYIQRQRADDVYTVAVDRSTWHPTGSPRQLAYPRTGRNIGAVWSPDGRSLAFVSSSPADPDHRYVIVMPEAGGEPREFPIPTTTYRYPQDPYDLRWFGDGTGLGFSGTDRHGEGALFRLTLATGQWNTYPLPVKAWTRIEWNDDGSRYFYARHGFTGETPAILERDLKGESERVVFRGAAADAVFRGLRFSPDRRLLAFTTGHIEGNQSIIRLLVVDTVSGEARTITEEKSGSTAETAVSIFGPTWAPDGRTLIATRTVGENNELRFFSLDGADVGSFALRAMFAGRGASAAGNSTDAIRDGMMSPDGSRMSFVRSSDRFDAAIIENIAAVASPIARR